MRKLLEDFFRHYLNEDNAEAVSGKKLFELISEALPGGIIGGYVEEDYPLYTINGKMLDILGYTYEEFVEATDEKVVHTICEEDRESVLSEITEQLAQKMEYELEYRVVGKENRLIWVHDIGKKIIVDNGREAIISILTDISERKEKEVEKENNSYRLETLAYTDTLTGMKNRVAFREAMTICEEYPRAACIVADINNLKLCNDRYGHAEGDKIITDAAECIREAFEPLGECYRIGGDEFCVLIHESDKNEIQMGLERIRELVAQKNKQRVMPLTIAAGYALRAGMAENMQHLFKRSDEMMYDVKYSMKKEFPVYCEERIKNYLSVLENLNQSTDDYLFLWDIGKDEWWYFGDIHKNYPLPKYEIAKNTSEEIMSIIHPADVKMLQEDLRANADGTRQGHDMNYRWINCQGESVWINCRARAISDDKGKPFVLIGRVSDQLLRYQYNSLTKLFNKEKLFRDFESECFEEGYLMLVSIDKLSDINLKYGRRYGNGVIKKCAKVLEEARSAQHVWHVDNNCFALYLNVSSEAEVTKLYDALIEKLSGLCTLSAGVVHNGKEAAEDGSNLYECAELTLEKAKSGGMGTILFYSNEEIRGRKRTIQLLDELRQNVENGCKGFYLCYQPQVKTGNYQIYGAEALLRYQSDTLGQVYPDEFIPLLEQSKLIHKVGLWVFEQALQQCRSWREAIPDFRVSVNLSAVQLMDKQVVEKVLDILDRTGVPGNALAIELTETTQLQDIQYLREIFNQWKEAGIELSIDDFGTGYSNMSYLKTLDINEIKIDRLFVEGVEEATYNYRFISSLIDFAKNNDIGVCCEGVENMKELVVLEGLSPNLIQGYLFAKPCDAERFEELFINRGTETYRVYEEFIRRIYQYKDKMQVIFFDAKDILRETDMGLWIIRIRQDEDYYEMHADETMERVLSVDRKYTPKEIYTFWNDRIKEGYKDYVQKNVKRMIESDKVVQLQYPWIHPQLGEVIVRCSGKRTEDSDGMITLKGYHRIISTIEETEL